MKKRKAEEDRDRGVERSLHPSCKDFISTMNALADYENDNQSILYTSDITPEFVDEFVDYLAEEREQSSSTEYKYKTKGGLKNSTINKRLNCLASLTRNYYKNHELTEMILQHKHLPFIIHSDSPTKMCNRFNYFNSPQELYKANDSLLSLSYRLLKKKGVLVVKTMDASWANKQCWVSNYVLNKADELGFEHIDTFILNPKTKIICNIGIKQHCARKWHSYFFVFKK